MATALPGYNKFPYTSRKAAAVKAAFFYFDYKQVELINME